MRPRPTGSVNLASSSHGGNSNQDGQEVPEHSNGDNHDGEEDKKSSNGANQQKEEGHERCTLATESLPSTIIIEMEEMFLRLGFSQTVAMKLLDDQGIDSPQTLASLSDKDIATICNMIRRAGG